MGGSRAAEGSPSASLTQEASSWLKPTKIPLLAEEGGVEIYQPHFQPPAPTGRYWAGLQPGFSVPKNTSGDKSLCKAAHPDPSCLLETGMGGPGRKGKHFILFDSCTKRRSALSLHTRTGGHRSDRSSK